MFVVHSPMECLGLSDRTSGIRAGNVDRTIEAECIVAMVSRFIETMIVHVVNGGIMNGTPTPLAIG
jgi:hypothetical protein